MRVCLNFICKNESKIIRRMLDSVRDVVDCVVACDTGSTDDTVKQIESWCIENGKSRDVHQFPFFDFSQARNDALARCRTSDMKFDYILFLDADFVGHGKLADLTAPVYGPKLVSGHVSYRRPQILRRDVQGGYVGATHEYFSTPSPVVSIDSFWIEDKGDGGSKADKYARDIRLLKADLEKNPTNPRSMYYLAESYRNSGQYFDAAVWYARRVEVKGWLEEQWHAAYMKAVCERELKNEPAFVSSCWTAYGMRPWRSEPLYALAKYWREQAKNEQAMAVCEIGRGIPYPVEDSLFVEDGVYAWGWLEEQSIVGFYCREEARRLAGADACRKLADGNFGRASVLARQNLRFYDRPGEVPLVSAIWMKRIDFPRRPGWSLFNPSILLREGKFFAVVRSSNYVIRDGRYIVAGADNVVRTESYLIRGDGDGQPIKLDTPIYPAKPSNVQGVEDLRLFPSNGKLMASATVCDHADGGGPRIGVFEIDPDTGACGPLDFPRGPFGERCEKNWMPVLHDGDQASWIYSPSSNDGQPMVATRGYIGWVVVPHGDKSDIKAPNARGGGQVVRFDGGWLAVVHEAHDNGGIRTYTHQFLWYDGQWKLTHASDPFSFRERNAIEFAAGLAVAAGGHILVSFGVRDAEAWVCAIDQNEVRRMLKRGKRPLVIQDQFGTIEIPDDGYVYNAIYGPVCVQDEYQFAKLAKEFPDAKTIVDLGASFGVATRMIQHYWPQAKVYAFEPDPSRAAFLNKNCDLGILDVCDEPVVGYWPDQAKALEGIGWGEPWRPSPEHAIRAPKGAIGQPDAGIDFGMAISATEAFATIDRIDLMKIDIEGFELGILRELAEVGKLPRVIVGEWHFRNCLDGLRALLEPTHHFQWIEPAKGAGPWQLFWARRK